MNKSIDEYTINCTPEQTKKAIELGALIKLDYKDNFQNGIKYGSRSYAKVPTAEQMIGWLETQGVNVYITKCFGSLIYKVITNKALLNETGFSSRPEATLAAINVALEYLENNRK